ncbi:MAG TPA: LpxD N-terminal domain-containing protein, partial [bacterium]|nr:LpxD N-terminal domain-containing protein [bacterium]
MRISFSLEDLAREIGATVRGDGSLVVTGIAPLDSAKEGDLTFLTNPRYAKSVADTRASAVLSQKVVPGVPKSFLLSANPYAALAKAISLFFP